MSNIFKSNSNSRFASLTKDIPANNDKRNGKEDINENQTKDIDIKRDVVKDDKLSDRFNSFKYETSDNKFNSFKDDKQTDRFNSFKDDKQTDIFNSFKDERPDDRFNSFKNNGNSGFKNKETQHYREQREFEEREKDRLKQESLKIENFPVLIIQSKKNAEQPSMNFIQTIKKEEEKITDLKNVDTDLANLKEGWVLFKRDPITNKTIIKRHPEKEYLESHNSAKSEQENINETMNKIIKTLSELHERRTNEFIELNGYDTWEKMFKFPGWREREAELENTSDSEDDYYENEEENTF
jgi:hypothetical protein